MSEDQNKLNLPVTFIHADWLPDDAAMVVTDTEAVLYKGGNVYGPIKVKSRPVPIVGEVE